MRQTIEERREKDRAYAKEWRKKNPGKIKAYLKETKKHRQVVREKYYEDNREHILKMCSKARKKNNYSNEKTGQRKIDALVRSKTRKRFPLKGNLCNFCNEPAEHRHHTTKPIEFDKFDFLCEDHHNKKHGRKTFAETRVDE